MRFFAIIAAIARFRIRPVWAAIWAVALCPLLVVLAVSVMSVVDPGKAAAAVAALADPLSVIGNRSPGARGAGAMTQTKPGYDHAKYALGDFNNVIPGERVLPNVRYREPTPLVIPPQAFATVPAPVEVAPGAGPVVASSPPSFPVFFGGPAGGGGTIGGPGGGGTSGGGGTGAGGTGGTGTGGGTGGGETGGGGTGGTGGGTGGGENPPPGSAVPEPMTWLMMIAGLFSIGVVLRSPAQRNGRSAGTPGRA